MDTLILILLPTLYVAAHVAERVRPGRTYPEVRGWTIKGVAFFVVAMILNGGIPIWITQALGGVHVVDLSGLGMVAGALVGCMFADLVQYGTHRLMHRVPALWRWTHQLHHSAERVDTAGFAYFHPIDLVSQIGSTSVIGLLLGLTPEANGLAGIILFVGAIITHVNVRTPRWLGWITQRPEAHAIHHARGVHAYNYGTFALWDAVFGTYRNPETFDEPAGFWDGASDMVVPMLVGRDVVDPTSARRVDKNREVTP
jgi:sterol desaturase/sphingolipid hydroxylase (fatty acid hydroxylase superfamily)